MPQPASLDQWHHSACVTADDWIQVAVSRSAHQLEVLDSQPPMITRWQPKVLCSGSLDTGRIGGPTVPGVDARPYGAARYRRVINSAALHCTQPRTVTGSSSSST